jgi:predicted O-methyltransferase YrrM
MRLLERYREGRRTRPVFDFVFIDGAHTWEVDGFAFFLVDKLLKPGGWLLFDDVHWTMAGSPTVRDSERVRALPDEEKNTPQIMRVFALLTMQHPDYSDFTVKGNWAWAYKNPGEVTGALPGDMVACLYSELPPVRNLNPTDPNLPV